MVILIVTEEQGLHMVGIALGATKCSRKRRTDTQRDDPIPKASNVNTEEFWSRFVIFALHRLL